jgi:hypothetical protein
MLELVGECPKHWLGISTADGGKKIPNALANESVVHIGSFSSIIVLYDIEFNNATE